jgi:hypothetical protein
MSPRKAGRRDSVLRRRLNFPPRLVVISSVILTCSVARPRNRERVNSLLPGERGQVRSKAGRVLIRMLSLRNLRASASLRLVNAENMLTAEAPRRRDYAEN